MWSAASSSGGGNESPRGTERTARRARVTSPTKSSSGLASYATSNSRSTVALRLTPPGRHDCTASVAAAMTATPDLPSDRRGQGSRGIFVPTHRSRLRPSASPAGGGAEACRGRRGLRRDRRAPATLAPRRSRMRLRRASEEVSLPSDRSARGRCVYRAAVAEPRAENAGRRSGANRVPCRDGWRTGCRHRVRRRRSRRLACAQGLQVGSPDCPTSSERNSV